MDNAKQVGGSSSSSSFTMDLFGPKDSSKSSSSSSSGLFGSVFGPSSTGLVRDSSHSGNIGLLRKEDVGTQYGHAKHDTSDYITNRSRGENSGVKREDPCYYSSSIYYGAQEVYSATNQTPPHHVFKKDEGDDDSGGNNLNCASRGNWWQGSLYY